MPTLSEGIAELYRLARMVQMDGTNHDNLRELHTNMQAALNPAPAEAAPDNVSAFPSAQAQANELS